MLGIKGDITKESINDAFKNLKHFSSDLWCKPWYFNSTVGTNVSNNTDITVIPQDGKMVQTEDCFDDRRAARQPARPDPGEGEGARPELLIPITSHDQEAGSLQPRCRALTS